MSNNVIELPGSRGRGEGTQQTVADNLAAELARKRISGRQAAKALGLTHVYVGRRVSGDVEMSVSDLMMFADYLGVSPGVLLGIENPRQSPNGGVSVGPTGIEPMTSTVEYGRLAEVIVGPWSVAA